MNQDIKKNTKEKDKEIESLKKELTFLREIALKDELTCLYNRHGFNEEVQKFLKEIAGMYNHKGRRSNVLIRNFSLIIYDIDNFKKINDIYGHQVGDGVLKKFSATVKENVRDIDVAARWGGEEIIVGLVGAGQSDAFKVADSIRKKIEDLELPIEGGDNLKFTVSGGVASFDCSKDFDDLFKRADGALYQAKNSGKNKIVKAD